jgi:hypothetical protein
VTDVVLLRNPNPAFAAVGALIAKGPVPAWLVLGLEHFSRGIAGGDFTKDDHKKFVEVFEEMERACDTLIQWLPLYEHIGFGIQCPDEVRIARDVLPLIKADLPHTMSIIERRPATRQGICAAVVVEARKFFGEAESSGEALCEACQAYWAACGRAEPERTNWPRDVELAIADDNGWIRQTLLAVQV